MLSPDLPIKKLMATQPKRRRHTGSWDWKAFFRDPSGQDLLEYALLAVVIALVAFVALKKLANICIGIPDSLLQKLYSAF